MTATTDDDRHTIAISIAAQHIELCVRDPITFAECSAAIVRGIQNQYLGSAQQTNIVTFALLRESVALNPIIDVVFYDRLHSRQRANSIGKRCFLFCGVQMRVKSSGSRQQ